MSDERDPSALPRWEELLRRLEQTHSRLESAHADYLEASAESQRALRRVVDAFGEISETIRVLVPQPDADGDEPKATDAARLPAKSGAADGDLLVPGKEADGATDDDRPEAKTPDDVDHRQNALPAHLHSRGVAIPESMETPTVFETDATVDSDGDRQASEKSPHSDLQIETPELVDAPFPEDGAPFSGLKKESRILLTNDGFGVAATLSEILSAEGYRVRVGSRRPDFDAPTDTVIFLGSLRAPSDLDDAMTVVDDAMYVAERMTTRLMQPDSGFVAAIDTSGGFGLDAFDPVAAPYGALLGLLRLLDRRHPGARTRLIDIDGGSLSNEQLAEALAAELLAGGDKSPIALGHDRRQSVAWRPFSGRSRPASWLDDDSAPLVYMPGPSAVLATAVERLAIAHELPVALLRRRHSPARIARKFEDLGIDVLSTKYDLNRLFSAMDFLDAVRSEYGPIAAIVAESVPANDPDDLARWEVMRPPVDEFNALLAMTINDPLHLLGVGIGPKTPPVVASALRYFARAESLRRNDHLSVRLAHLHSSPRRDGAGFNPRDFALTEFLSGADPLIAEARFGKSKHR